MKSPISLQKKLLKNAILSSMIAGVLAWGLSMGITAYQVMAIQDEIMQEIADVLLGDVNQGRGIHIDEISEEYDIQYSLKLNDWELTSSEQTQLLQQPLHQAGFHFRWIDGQLQRVFLARDDELIIQMAQPLGARFNEIWRSVFGFAGILAVLWLLQWGMLRYMIQRQLQPLRQISTAIAQKGAQDLMPIASPEPEVHELKPIVRQLNAMLKRLEQALTAEQRFTADASHELRSPLSAIQMRLQVLKRKYQHEPQLLQDVQHIQRDVSRGVQVLENLLLLARLDPQQSQQLPKQKNSLQQLMDEVFIALEPFIDEKQLQLNVQLLDAEIWVNRELMLSCFRNLIDNAIRYTPNEGMIRIESHIQQQQLYLLIENAGGGLSAEIIARLGERFYRVLGTQTQGSGLGLSICQKIATLHDASLQFSASELGGLKVELLIPLWES